MWQPSIQYGVDAMIAFVGLSPTMAIFAEPHTGGLVLKNKMKTWKRVIHRILTKMDWLGVGLITIF